PRRRAYVHATSTTSYGGEGDGGLPQDVVEVHGEEVGGARGRGRFLVRDLHADFVQGRYWGQKCHDLGLYRDRNPREGCVQAQSQHRDEAPALARLDSAGAGWGPRLARDRAGGVVYSWAERLLAWNGPPLGPSWPRRLCPGHGRSAGRQQSWFP